MNIGNEKNKKLMAAYRKGQRWAGRSWIAVLYSEDGDEIRRWLDCDPVTALFFEAGFENEPLPRWVEAEGYGPVPAEGRSKNHRDNVMEPGVSVARLLDGSDDYTWCMGSERTIGRPIHRVAGWLHFRRGSDGEPILVGAVDLGETKGGDDAEKKQSHSARVADFQPRVQKGARRSRFGNRGQWRK